MQNYCLEMEMLLTWKHPHLLIQKEKRKKKGKEKGNQEIYIATLHVNEND